AGWRGLLDGVIGAALATLERAAPGARLVAAMGPAIGPCCFQVGPDVASRLEARFGAAVVRPDAGDRSLADMPAAARRALVDRGEAGEGATGPRAPDERRGCRRYRRRARFPPCRHAPAVRRLRDRRRRAPRWTGRRRCIPQALRLAPPPPAPRPLADPALVPP